MDRMAIPCPYNWKYCLPVVHLLGGLSRIFLQSIDVDVQNHQTRTLVRAEGILTQLIFAHALRIRMKAELPESTGNTAPSTAVPSPDSASVSEQPISTETSESSTGSGDETLAQSISSSVKSASKSTKKDKQKPKDKEAADPKTTPAKESSADNLVGKINNLVTTDLNNITEARDFLMFGEWADQMSFASFN